MSASLLRLLRQGLPCALFVVGTSGCALTSKADIVTTRYFSPDVSRAHLTGSDASGARAGAPSGVRTELRLGKVSSGAHLRERIAYRDSAYETNYYEDQRWTERPDIYVRTEVMRALFESAGFHRVLSGSAPTLDVDVIAFDELRLPDGRAARVQIKIVLFEERSVILEETLTVDRKVVQGSGKGRMEELVAAMAEALDAVAAQVAARVATAIAARRAPVVVP